MKIWIMLLWDLRCFEDYSIIIRIDVILKEREGDGEKRAATTV